MLAIHARYLMQLMIISVKGMQSCELVKMIDVGCRKCRSGKVEEEEVKRVEEVEYILAGLPS